MNNVNLPKLREKALALPLKPGVYKMLNENGNIIYVGKAKLLRNRVYSYFHSVEKHNEKTFALVSNIADFEIIITGSEFEALLLESNLIKEHKPKYNILLKDDKGYPFIKIDINSEFPRVTLAYKREDKKAKYFGPFGGSFQTKQLINAACNAYKLPTCSLFSVNKNKKPCLNRHIGRCMGVCIGEIQSDEYKAIIKSVINFFEGKTREAREKIEKSMYIASEQMNFEKAAYYRDTIKAIDRLNDSQKIITSENVYADGIASLKRDGYVSVSIIRVRNGKMIGTFNYAESESEENSGFDLFEYMTRFYEEDTDIPSIIYLDKNIEDSGLLSEYIEYLSKKKVKILVPRSGNGKKILETAAANAGEYLTGYQGKTDKISRQLIEFSEVAGLDFVPKIIEMYDISQTAGQDTVCGMICYNDGKPEKSRYRKFIIKDAVEGDDCGSMKEAVSRRIERYFAGDEGFAQLPDLIIADGGQAQVGAILEILKDRNLNIKVIGLKKDNHHRTKSVVRENMSEIALKNTPEAFVFASLIQNEVHRFAIEFHKKRRSDSVKRFDLTNVEGVGKSRAIALLSHFKSIKAIREASIEDLMKVKGITNKIAHNIKEIFD